MAQSNRSIAAKKQYEANIALILRETANSLDRGFIHLPYGEDKIEFMAGVENELRSISAAEVAYTAAAFKY